MGSSTCHGSSAVPMARWGSSPRPRSSRCRPTRRPPWGSSSSTRSTARRKRRSCCDRSLPMPATSSTSDTSLWPAPRSRHSTSSSRRSPTPRCSWSFRMPTKRPPPCGSTRPRGACWARDRCASTSAGPRMPQRRRCCGNCPEAPWPRCTGSAAPCGRCHSWKTWSCRPRRCPIFSGGCRRCSSSAM